VVRTGCQWDALPVDFPPAPLVKHFCAAFHRGVAMNTAAWFDAPACGSYP
jgi:hypothetical protein